MKALQDTDPVVAIAHRDFIVLHPENSVTQARRKIQGAELSDRILYFYVADAEDRLLGIIPVRTLLTAEGAEKIENLYVRKIIALDFKSTVRDAREAFARHRFLALPVTDEHGRVGGVVDIESFAGELGDLKSRTGFDDVYELLGMENEVANLPPWGAFRARFPWLTTTIFTGSCAALITSYFETTLEHAILFAFFLTMVLGLNESVAMQSATIAVQGLRHTKPRWTDFLKGLFKEGQTGFMLGLACAFCVFTVAFAWRREPLAAAVLGSSLIVSIGVSSLWGWIVPNFLHYLQKDPKVAAAPIALGLSDLTTLWLYFSLAKRFFG